jgi:hypothetical protein
VRIVFALIALSAFPFFLNSQESRATLSGRVTDPQGSVIADAQIAVIADDTGVVQHSQTNEKGNWTVLYLLPGNYHFIVSASGFEKVTRSGIVLEVADNKTVDVQLQVGSNRSAVTVTADTPLIDTSSASSGVVIGSKEILEMPSVSRLPSDLATLSAGVYGQDPGNNINHAWSHDGASALRVGGGSGVRSNNYLLDGFPNVKSGGQLAFSPPPDSLSEFRVQMNAYDSSIGRQAGGTINMTTKSGTAGYHGELYEFNQNNILNAQLFQTNLAGGEKPVVHYNEYGGTFGGPVWIPKVYNGRQKTFFFVSFNGIRNSNPTFGPRSLPTALERQGDFSKSYTTQVINGDRIRYPIQVYDPQSVNSRGYRQLFPGNVIPINRLNPVAQNILKYVPLPNHLSDGTSTDNNNFFPDSIRRNKMAAISTRADHQWNDNNRSFGVVRWYHEDESAYDDFHSPATGGIQTRIAQNLGLDHVITASANKVLDFRFNVIRYGDTSADHGSGFDLASLGIPENFVSQLRVPSFPRITGFAGDFGTGNAGNYNWTTYYTWSANLAHIIGNHTLHYGAEYWVLQQANASIGNQGQFDFSNSNWTRQQATVDGGVGNGSNVASFLLGLPNSGNVPRNADGFYSQRFTGLYFQDDWRVSSKLTLNVGIRWDYENPVTERYNRLTSNFDPNAINPTSDQIRANYGAIATANRNNPNVQALLGIVPVNGFQVRGEQLFAGVNGQTRGINSPDWHEFQPRLGFAYQIRPTTVIRGGIGRFTTATFDTGGQNGFGRTTPLTPTQDNFVTPDETLSNPFQSGILAPTGSSLGPLTNLGQGVSWYNQNFNRPYSLIYSLTLQQQVKSWLFEVGYLHNKSYGTAWSRNQNLPGFDLWNQLRTPRFDASGRPLDKLLWDELVPNPFYGNPNFSGSISTSKQVAINQLVRPLAYLGDQTRANNPWGTTQYDGMLVNVTRRFSSGFSFKGGFTWSKLMDTNSFLGPEIALTPNHVISPADRTFITSIAPVWEIPIGRGKKLFPRMPKWADAFAGGWQLTGQYLLQSGLPVTFSNNNFFFDGQDASLSRDERALAKWFDTSHFLRFPDKNTDISNYPVWTGVQNLPGYNYKPKPGDNVANGVYQDFGNYISGVPTRWSNIRGDNVNQLSLGIYKNFNFAERYRFQYRFETFNTLNHPRFGAPNADPTSSTFGQVSPSQVNNARLIQMALKLYF